MACRGLKGATTATDNAAPAILEATKALLTQLLEANRIDKGDVAAMFFTSTVDLDAVFPARAARELGWNDVPLLCAQEVDVPGSLRRCIRVTVLVNTDQPQAALRHLYLEGARTLRPDLS